MLIRQIVLKIFLAFTSNSGYIKIIGHRIAALVDSILLPLTEQKKIL